MAAHEGGLCACPCKWTRVDRRTARGAIYSRRVKVKTNFRPGTSRVLTSSGYAGEVVTKAPAWHGLVAWDLLLNGMTTGLFLVAAISELTVPDVFTSVANIAYPIALVLLLLDLLFLVFDLGDALR